MLLLKSAKPSNQKSVMLAMSDIQDYKARRVQLVGQARLDCKVLTVQRENSDQTAHQVYQDEMELMG